MASPEFASWTKSVTPRLPLSFYCGVWEEAMHYFQFNIGDYRAATAHLSNDEDLAYRRLLDMYYDTEKKIPLDTQWVARRLRMSPAVVKTVLDDMFVLHDDGWSHDRCDQVIHDYHAMAEKNRINGRLGGRKKNPVGSQSEPSAQPTINEETINDKPINTFMSEPTVLTCPQKEILILWKKHLPALSQPRSWEGARQAALKQRWIQASKPSSYSEGYKTEAEGLVWWDAFFAYLAKDTSLASGYESAGRVWRPDLEWVINATNFQKIIDGKYDK
jgi:uncharacterized protein YdaU (DUF1376 family)